MQRRTLLQGLAALLAMPLLPACAREAIPAPAPAGAGAAKGKGQTIARLRKPEAEWKALLSPAAFAVLFRDDTERPFSSALNNEKRRGSYICAACHLPLFKSEHKFDSGTGWPSFTQAIAGHTGSKRDFKLILPRTEYHCVRCGGHQGHIFNDGPAPRGERWCNNGVALNFVPEGTPLPSLRS
ncbi:MAG: peptide-methionine (R)-S-oxide reductase MsrB [Pseudomonadota bacterium]|nr:peptide-methionine (R)-S-oxide reductase MsrB [Pseudomonadota bacterium]